MRLDAGGDGRGQDSRPPSGASLKQRIDWGGGVALPVCNARISIAGQVASATVASNDDAAVFTLSLPAGATHLQTWFELESGEALGAYYVYVEEVSTGANST